MAVLAVAGCVSAADAQQRDPSKDFNTLVASALGIWSDGTTMWVVSPSEIFAYKMSDKSRDPSKDFDTLYDAGNTGAVGIWSNGTTMWVVDTHDRKIYAYKMSDKSRDPSKDFDPLYDAGNLTPWGIWSDGTTMWVVDSHDRIIHAYKMSDKSRDPSKDLYDAGHLSPWGIWSDGTTMWVVDVIDNKIYAYSVATKSRDPSKDFNTLPVPPSDIWSDGTTLWVLDYRKIYAYKMSAAPTRSPLIFDAPPPPRDTTPPTVVSVERTGNATTTDRALTWNVVFSEPVVVVGTNAYVNYTSVANVTIPDLGAVRDTVLVDVPGAVTGGSISVDLHHRITSGLLIELVSPDCTRFVIHNQTTTFLYKLRQPYDLGDLAGVGAAGQWTLQVSDHAEYWNGTLNAWSLELESVGAIEGNGDTYTITRHVAGPGNHTLSLDGYEVRDRAGNLLADAELAASEPYHVVGAAARTCQME